ncbi:MAG: hypothetical protein EOM55_01365 [Clostridia bacterium]|nr:hypothetical protein [Clostridia bacterium]
MTSIFFGKTSDDCFFDMFMHLKQNGEKTRHYVFVVPDRMTVIVEKQIFERLNIESTCNIEVLTLSRLFSKLVHNKTIISKTASCMILQKILKDEKDNLKCFNRNADADLAQVIFGTISQFKSCKVSFDEVLVKNTDKLLEDKLSDIALIYRKYETFLRENNLFDALDKLTFLLEAVKDSDYIKNSCFYFCGFDGLTMQGYEIVSNISKFALDFNFGLTQAESSLNGHIYNENFTSNIINILKNKKNNVFYHSEKRTGQSKFLQENLFCFSPACQKLEKSNVELFKAKDFKEEVLYCALNIKKMIMKEGFSFDDFIVAVPNLADKKLIIDDVFSKFNFNFYLDTSEEFKDSVVFRLIKNSLDLFVENFSIKSVLTFLKNPLLMLERDELDDFEDYAINFNLQDSYEIRSSHIFNSIFFEKFGKIRDFLFEKTEKVTESFKEAKTFSDYIITFKLLFENLFLKEKISHFCEKFTLNNDLKQARIFEQYYDKFILILDELEDILGNVSCDFKTFSSTLLSGFSVVKISTTPLSIDSIVVGDTSTSYFEKRKILFVLCANEQDFPKTFVDCGIISDDDIKNLSEKYKLEPSIFELNKKERFKAYELLLKPTEKLFLSYNFLSGEKSKILSDISNMFVIEENGKFAPLAFKNFGECDFLTKNCEFSVAKSNLTSDIRAVCDGVLDKNDKLNTLYESLKDKLEKNYIDNFNFKNEIKLKENLFFMKNTTSVSQVENFMTCPFLHFASRGLKLASKDEGKLERNFIGLILHEIAREVLGKVSLPQDENFVKNETNIAYEKVVAKDEYMSFQFSISNKILFKNLKNEAEKFLLALNEQAKHSKFVPKYLEERFSENGKIKGLKIPCKDKTLSLVGQVDRIDIAGDYFRIVDYKTGDVDTNLRELFFGKKIQLESYLKVCENSLRLKPAGAYYLPVKGGFSDEKTTLQKKYQLKGNTVDSFEVACLSDDRFEKDALDSDILEVKFKLQKEEKVKGGYSKVVSEKDLHNFGNYAVKLIEKACDDIRTLNITPFPLVISSKDPCEKCIFSGLCRFDKSFGNCKRNVKLKISKENFEEEEK